METAMNNTASVNALIAFYEDLSPASVARFPEFYADDAFFKDPFNEVRGVVSIQHIFTHMFRQLSEPRFVVCERVLAENGVLLVSERQFRRLLARGESEAQLIRGASHLKFDAAGKVAWHRDYWDAAEELYEKLSGIGWLMRFLKKRLAA